MIVVVEGPSGAGKTTWCRTHGRRFALLEELPDHAAVPNDPEEQARFWVERNVARWRQVMERERRDSLVVVDTDPFKLHYVWTLWRTGQVPRTFDDATLRARREADKTRTRRGFDCSRVSTDEFSEKAGAKRFCYSAKR